MMTLFTLNKYTTTYYAIIEKARREGRSGYTERHHIIPTSLGGANSTSNTVFLSGREHLVCHLLLVKMLDGQERLKMLHALNMMTNRMKVHSRAYHKLKEEWCALNRKQVCSAETRSKISKANKGRSREFTADHKANMVAAWEKRRGGPKPLPITQAEAAIIKHERSQKRSARMKLQAATNPSSLKQWQQAGMLARQAKAKPKPQSRVFSDPEETKRKMSEARSAYWANKRLRADPAL